MPREKVVRQATALAQVIQAEMQFPVQPRPSDKARLIGTLLDEPLKIDQVTFQQQGGDATPKVQLREGLVVEERMLKLFFCVFHNEFALDAGTNIDHVFAFERIRQKQIKLLAFLNADQEFANVFLDQPGIGDFFRRGDDGLIRGTSYFFKLCYNDIGNLLLMCHACNIRKSVADPLEWFRRQEDYFGGKFVKEVTTAGGLQDGVILPKIYRPSAEDVTLNIDGDDIRLHTGESQGLGAYAYQWFSNNFRSVYDTYVDFYTSNYRQFRETLDEMRLLIINNNIKGARDKHRMLQKILKGYEAVCDALIEAEEKRESDTESDDNGDSKKRKRRTAKAVTDIDLITHVMKKIKIRLRESYPGEVAKAVYEKCDVLQDGKGISGEEWRSIFLAMKTYITNAETSDSLPAQEELEAKITELYREIAYAVDILNEQLKDRDRRLEEAARQRAEVERRAEEEARQRADAERRAEEAARQRADAERRAEEEAQRSAELRARLERYEREERQPGFFEGRGEERGERKRSASPGEVGPYEGKRARGANG